VVRKIIVADRQDEFLPADAITTRAEPICV
jgi:hypothetical protein